MHSYILEFLILRYTDCINELIRESFPLPSVQIKNFQHSEWPACSIQFQFCTKHATSVPYRKTMVNVLVCSDNLCSVKVQIAICVTICKFTAFILDQATLARNPAVRFGIYLEKKTTCLSVS